MIDRLQQAPPEILPVGEGVPFYSEKVPGDVERGLGGMYGGWGRRVPNENLPSYVADFLGRSLDPNEILELESKGFKSRYSTLHLRSDDQKLEQALAETLVGMKSVEGAIWENGWDSSEIDAVVIGMSSPLDPDFTVDLANLSGISPYAKKVTVHTACDSSMRGLNWVLDPKNGLYGKKVILGGLENLSRSLTGGDGTRPTKDTQALQLFANAVGFIGIVPGVSIQPIAVRSETKYDEKAALQVAVNYPMPTQGENVAEKYDSSKNHLTISGRIPKPGDGTGVVMANNKEMLKLFGINTAEIVKQILIEMQENLGLQGDPNAWFQWVVMHHANLKIIEFQSKKLGNDIWLHTGSLMNLVTLVPPHL